MPQRAFSVLRATALVERWAVVAVVADALEGCRVPWAADERRVKARRLSVRFGMGACAVACRLAVAVGFCSFPPAFFFAFAVIAPTYSMLAWHLDNSWGFLLKEGHDYTAPVWVGEFGGQVSGNYWVNFVRYLSERDADFAHWALNGRKWTTGFIDTTEGGKWVDQDPHWTDEPFGVLQADYKTIRHPWMMMDLHALQSSPAQYRPPPPPCDRRVLGSSCGG